MVMDAGRHPVTLGTDALRALDHDVKQAEASTLFVLGDENTLRHALPELLAHVPALRDAETIGVAAGEASKSLGVCQEIWQHLTVRAADREALLINLGGGVVTDLGGFVAGAYKRGIRCMHVPTTLMGMVDAAIGGKTGIDLGGVKNLVGVFHDPLGVYVHGPFLRSLGKRELLNGVAEMIKHGLVRDADHYESLREAPLHDLDALTPLVQRSAAIKAEVVKADPRESGLRKLLNFGHTIGHAVEAVTEYRQLTHGEAVAIGMAAAAKLSVRLGYMQQPEADRISSVLEHAGLPTRLAPYPAEAVREVMRRDKKVREGKMRFVLAEEVGKVFITSRVREEDLLALWG